MATVAPLASHFSCWRRSPEDAPPGQRLADDETRRQGQQQHQDHVEDGPERPGRIVDGRQSAGRVDAERARRRAHVLSRRRKRRAARCTARHSSAAPSARTATTACRRETAGSPPRTGAVRGPQLVSRQPHRAEREVAPEAVDGVPSSPRRRCPRTGRWPTARNSQPSGLPGWRRATRNPTPAHGTPMTTATIPSPSWPDSTVSGRVAARETTARPPSAAAQPAAGPARDPGTAAWPAAAAPAGPVLSTRATLRPDRSGNVTGQHGPLNQGQDHQPDRRRPSARHHCALPDKVRLYYQEQTDHGVPGAGCGTATA